MIATAEISQMTPAEKLETMERIWESFSQDGMDCPSPDWHADALTEREAHITSGKANWLTVDELQQRLMKSK